MLRIRLVRKLALCMNGVDVSGLKVGDALELSEDRAQMMIDQGWAEAIAHAPDARPLDANFPTRRAN